MPYCPKCRYEYQEDIEFCSDCGVDLVIDLPPEIDAEYADADWIELHTFPGTLYARMAVEMLQREGIPAYSQSLFGGGLGFGPAGGADYVGASATVFVLEPDFEGALDIIQPMVDELPELGMDGSDSDDYEV
ncbi:MAG: zinc ribbon domain-containing protein [Calditrichota bacterium]